MIFKDTHPILTASRFSPFNFFSIVPNFFSTGKCVATILTDGIKSFIDDSCGIKRLSWCYFYIDHSIKPSGLWYFIFLLKCHIGYIWRQYACILYISTYGFIHLFTKMPCSFILQYRSLLWIFCFHKLYFNERASVALRITAFLNLTINSNTNWM